MQAHQPRTPRTVTTKWSATGAATAHSCPARYFWESIVPEPHAENPLAAWGISMHYLFQRFMTPHPRTGRYPYDKLETFLKVWKGLWWGAVAGRNPFNSLVNFDSKSNRRRKRPLQPVEVFWQHPGQPGSLFKQGTEFLTDFYRRHVRRRSDGTHRLLEQRFNINRWFGLNVIGIIDRVDVQPQGAWIIDYKNGRLDETEIVSGPQLTTYQLAFAHLRARGKIPGNAQLRGMFIYNYRRGEFQPAPLRSPEEIGLWYLQLRQLNLYWEGVLYNRRYPGRLHDSLSSAHIRDIELGDARPRLPRGPHCKYCRVFRQCREWELGKRPPARQAFADYHQLRRQARMPNQTRLPILQEPTVVEIGHAFERLSAEVLPEQLAADAILQQAAAVQRRRSKSK